MPERPYRLPGGAVAQRWLPVCRCGPPRRGPAGGVCGRCGGAIAGEKESHVAVTIVCPQCDEHGRGRRAMRYRREVNGGLWFVCDTCGTNRVVSNDKLGRRLDAGPGKPARGTGFGPGPVR